MEGGGGEAPKNAMETGGKKLVLEKETLCKKKPSSRAEHFFL